MDNEYKALAPNAISSSWARLSDHQREVANGLSNLSVYPRHRRTFNLTNCVSIGVDLRWGGLRLMQTSDDSYNSRGSRNSFKDSDFFSHVTGQGPRIVLRTCRRIDAVRRWMDRVDRAVRKEHDQYLTRNGPILDELRIIVAQHSLDS